MSLESLPIAEPSSAHEPEAASNGQIALREPFAAFYAHFGPRLCGPPLTEVLEEDGVPTQYFRNLVLEERQPGRVSLRPAGEAMLVERSFQPMPGAEREPSIHDISAELVQHASARYPSRPLADVRYLVIHHSGTAAEMGAERLAEEHVRINGWPGIGYHFVIDPEGRVQRCQDLTTASYHCAQFNPAAVGVALLGDLSQALPAEPQLRATSTLIGRLCLDLGLPLSAVRGHGELVGSPCPGARFARDWKADLLAGAERWLRAQLRRQAQAEQPEDSAATGESAP